MLKPGIILERLNLLLPPWYGARLVSGSCLHTPTTNHMNLSVGHLNDVHQINCFASSRTNNRVVEGFFDLENLKVSQITNGCYIYTY